MNSFLFVVFLLIDVNNTNSTLQRPNTILQSDSVLQHPAVIYEKYVHEVDRKSRQIQTKVDKRAMNVINRLSRVENKMRSRMAKKDSVMANEVFNTSIGDLSKLKARLLNKLPPDLGIRSASLDTLTSTLDFLGENKYLVNMSKVSQAKERVAALSNSLDAATNVKSLINRHRKQLKDKLSGYTGFTKDLKKINKEVYYYGEQIKEYKSLLKDKKKVEAKALATLRKVPLYNKFLHEHATLLRIVNLGAASGDPSQILEGLQTRSRVEQLIQQRLGNDPAARQAITQQIDEARGKLNELKDKFPDLDNAGEMPDFKPSPMKNKSLFQRLEFGANIQFQKSNQYFPTTADIAGQVGYKFHKNGVLGVGAAYKLGMGTGWSHVVITHQGMGIRSFVDWKLKGTFFVNGGLEKNRVTTISQLSAIPAWSGWQSSALLGISKKYKVSSKVKGNIVLLYDFLAKQNPATTSPIKLRLGYNF